MIRKKMLVMTACLALCAGHAFGQTMSARRMAMGGVSLGSSAQNVAYRAVPKAKGGSSGLTLPLGIAQIASNPPTLDPNDPKFNAFELVDLVENPPWNYQLNKPAVPSSDVTLTIGRNQLAVDLGDIRSYLPRDGNKVAALQTTPSIGLGFHRLFADVAMVTEIQNHLDMNDALRGALIDGQDFQPNTTYAVMDDGKAQAVAELQVGMALPLAVHGNPRTLTGFGLYGGVRANALRGIAYGEVHEQGSFATSDSLFANNPIDVTPSGNTLSAGPNGGGFGAGFDLGAVMLAGGFEIGLGVNHIGASVPWTGTEQVTVKDTASSNYKNETVDDHKKFTSTIPLEVTANVSRKVMGFLVAADVTSAMSITQAHVGVERWLGPLALRVGGHVDEQQKLQESAGAGLKLGPFGLDAAVATHARSFGGDRGLELGVGLALYH